HDEGGLAHAGTQVAGEEGQHREEGGVAGAADDARQEGRQRDVAEPEGHLPWPTAHASLLSGPGRSAAPGRPIPVGRPAGPDSEKAASRVWETAFSSTVELRGFEPLTPSMPWRCATNCATAPKGPVED